ncbi:DUF6577 family protein [Alkalibacterium putridalgicola]|uniref:DUF6577 family protein n=1 Tax=Alkalibacterium putridalgicola TaxID=426703 RepID=UPI0034CDEF57
MRNALHINDLIEFLKKNHPINTQDFLDFYHQFDPDLPITTLRWRIYELKKEGVIFSPKRGLYALNEKKLFQPKPTKKMTELAHLLQGKFPYVDFSIYPTKWIGNLSSHVYQTDNLIVEIDADVLEAAFHFLKENYPNTFLSPDQKMYDYYISPQEENIIVKRLYVDSPLNKINNNYYTPKLEKLIVDLLINDPIILPIGVSDIRTVIMNILDTYSINYSTLNRYAKKRNAEKSLEKLHLKGGPGTE